MGRLIRATASPIVPIYSSTALVASQDEGRRVRRMRARQPRVPGERLDVFFCEVCGRVLSTTLDELRAQGPRKGEVYTQLIVRVTEGGTCSLLPHQICAEILAARPFDGSLPSTQRNTSPYLFELTSGGRSIAEGPLTFQRLDRRSLGVADLARRSETPVEQMVRGESSIFVFHVPGASTDQIPNVSVTIHELRRPAGVPYIDRARLDQLKNTGGLIASSTSNPAPLPQ